VITASVLILLALLGLLSVPLAIGLAVNRDDLGVMREAINQGTAHAAFGKTVCHCSNGKVVVEYRIVTSQGARSADTMRDWFSTLAAKSSLPVDAVSDLAERGFVVLPGPVPSEEMNAFVAAYTAAMTSASLLIKESLLSLVVVDADSVLINVGSAQGNSALFQPSHLSFGKATKLSPASASLAMLQRPELASTPSIPDEGAAVV
jgi:hypothetical protein